MTKTKKEQYALLVGLFLVLVVCATLFYRYQKAQHKDVVQEIPLDSTQQNQKSLEAINVSAVEKLLRKNSNNIVFVDVRSPAFFDIDHLPGAQNIPFTDLSIEKVFVLPENVIVFVDQNGEQFKNKHDLIDRIAQTARQQKRSVFYLDGGFTAWKTQSTRTVSQGDPASFVDHAKLSRISVEELHRALSNKNHGYTVIDVREAQAYDKNHIDGAGNIPLNTLKENITNLPRDRTIFVYGKDALESFRAGVQLHDLNFFFTRTLDGGFEDYQK